MVFEDTYPVRKDIRLKNYNYASNGYYFITICAKDRQAFIKNKPLIEDIFQALPTRFTGLTLDYNVVMDDHVHAILVLEGSSKSISETIRQFKALVTLKAKRRGIWQRGFYEHVVRNEKALAKSGNIYKIILW